MMSGAGIEDEKFHVVSDRTSNRLLNKSKDNNYGTKADNREEDVTSRSQRRRHCLSHILGYFPEWFLEECYEMFNLSWSMFVISLFSFLLAPISLIFVGHLGVDQLAGVAMAATVLNVTGISIAAGLTTACDTVFSQSMGSGNKSIMGVYLVKSCIIILLFVFPCWAVHLNVERLLLLMGQDPIIAMIAGDYLVAFMPGIPFVFITNILMKYLRCQDIIMPTMVVGAAGCACNVVLHWIFLWELSMGTDGSAYAMAISFAVMAVGLMVHIWYQKIYLRTWKGWSMDILSNWGMFIELAVAGMLMIGLEWGAYEVGIITSGLLGPVALGASSVTFQLIIIVYMIPMGIGLACNIRVGQHIGANKIVEAKQTIYVGLGICFVCALTICVGMVLLCDEIPKIFSDDPDVIKYTSDVLPLAGLVEFFDGFAGVYGGILRGCGRQVIGTVVMIVGFYVIGLPIGLSLMFYTSMEVQGLYCGLAVGVAVETVCFFVIVLKTDWDEVVQQAQIRTGTIDLKNADPETGKFPEQLSLVKSARIHGSSYSLSRVSIPQTMLTQSSRPGTTRKMLVKATAFVLIMTLMLVFGAVADSSLGTIDHSFLNISLSTSVPLIN